MNITHTHNILFNQVKINIRNISCIWVQKCTTARRLSRIHNYDLCVCAYGTLSHSSNTVCNLTIVLLARTERERGRER